MARKDDKGRVLRTNEYQRKDGRYTFRYKDRTGKTHYIYSNRLNPSDKTLKGKRKDLSLREKEEEIMKDQLDGISGGDITVLQLVERYVATKECMKLNTKKGYQTQLNRLRREAFGSMKIRDVHVEDAKKWFIKLHQEDELKYNTISSARGVLRPAFNMAVEEDMIGKNSFQFKLSEVVPEDSEPRIALTAEEEEEFLRFVKQDSHYSKYYDAFFILLNTGLRISEFCVLTKNDVNYEKGYISVTGQLLRYSDMVYRVELPKSKAGKRKIPMTKEVEQSFRRLWANRKTVNQSEPVVDGRSEFFCLDQFGKPTVSLHWENYITRIREKYYKKYHVHLPRITPHVMRHTFATKMVRKNMGTKQLAHMMGHAKVSVTLDIYTHLEYEDVKEEFQRVANL